MLLLVQLNVRCIFKQPKFWDGSISLCTHQKECDCQFIREDKWRNLGWAEGDMAFQSVSLALEYVPRRCLIRRHFVSFHTHRTNTQGWKKNFPSVFFSNVSQVKLDYHKIIIRTVLLRKIVFTA